MAEAILLDQISKRFIIRHQRSRSFQQVMINFWRRSSDRQEFWALRDVSLSIAPGDSLGIIGENGSGKSTLLKLISRILEPTSGRLRVNGRVAALLEIGAGFHPDLTGRENVFLNGSVLGFSRRQLQACFDDIAEFSELGDFLDTPIRHYSSGMHMRLGFAVAVNLDPDILLLDEVLAVGDEHFQQKCFDRMNRLLREGRTMVLVSHDLGAVSRLCRQAVWLHEGRIRLYGPSPEVVDAYLTETTQREQWQRWIEAEQKAKVRSSRTGAVPGEDCPAPTADVPIRLTGLRFLDPDGRETTRFRTGERFLLRLSYQAPKPVEDPVFGIAIYTPTGVQITGPNTGKCGYDIERVEGEGEIDYIVDSLPLAPGAYVVAAAVHDRQQQHIYDYHEHMGFFTVLPKGAAGEAMLEIPARWEHRPAPALAGSAVGPAAP